jgi:hypothetical protein
MADDKELIEALDFLGGGPHKIGFPGGADINVGAGPAPAPGVNVGTFGRLLSPSGGGPGGAGGGARSDQAGGSDILALLQKSLGVGQKGSDFLKRLLGEDQGTRGDTGGTSLSDVLRSGGGQFGAASGASGAGGAEPVGMNLTRTLGETVEPNLEATLQNLLGQGLSPDQIMETLGGLEGATSGAQGAGVAAPEAVGGAGSAGTAGTAGAGAGAVAALLSLLAQETGNADLGKAASALGLAAGGATTGAGVAATAAGEAVAGGTAGAAALPLAAAWLPIMALTMATGESPDFSDIATGGRADPWTTFGSRLGQTLGQEGQDLGSLASILPYVNSQAGLNDLLSQFKSSVGQRVGGYGEGAAPFTIPNLPGAGGSAHEGGANVDFGDPVNALNQILGQYSGMLPATATGGPDIGSMWNQLGENTRRQQARASGFNESLIPFLTPEDAAGLQAAFPEPTPLTGTVNPLFQKLIAQMSGGGVPNPTAGSTMPPAIVSALAGGGGTAEPGAQLPDVWSDFLKQQQAQAA